MNNLHPGLILIATGILMIFLPEKARKWGSVAGAVVALVAMINLSENSSMSVVFTSNITFELLKVDALSRAFGLIFCLIAVIAGIYAMSDKSRGEKVAELVYAGSSISVVFAADWISLVCFWELMAVSSMYLVWTRRTGKSVRAAFRYMVMHLFGGNMLLAGAIIISIHGGTGVELLSNPGDYGYWLIFIGVAVNGAIPPVNSWISDAYPEATISGTVYMGSYTTKVAIYALIRLFAGTEWLIVVGGVMAVFGACMALIENDLRRLLSYHIVSQLGMMIAASSVGTAVGIDGATAHAVNNILYKGVLLMGAGIIIKSTGKRKISQLGGLYKKMPVVAICFLIGSLAIAGMPFLNGFASKALIMTALKDSGATLGWWLVTIAGVGTWLSITLKINYFVFFGKTDKEIETAKVPYSMTIAMIIATALCIITGIWPNLVYELMPYGTVGHIFTAEHILEYLGLFIGATIPFAILIKKMAPHDMLTLDFDWIYRKPLCAVVVGISKAITAFFNGGAAVYKDGVNLVRVTLNNPGKTFSRVRELNEEGEEGDEDIIVDEKPIGDHMSTFVLVLIIGFLIVMIIE